MPVPQFKLDVIIGDEGGEFGAGLFLQKKGENYGRGNTGCRSCR